MAATITSIGMGSGTATTHWHPDILMGGLTTGNSYRLYEGANLLYTWGMIEGDGSGTLTLRMIWAEFAKDVEYTIYLHEHAGANWSEVDSEVFTIELPTPAISPTPSDGSILVAWNDTLSWVAGANTDSYLITVDGNYLTIWPRATVPDFTDTSYTLATVNEWYGRNDFDLFDPYNGTHTWRVYSYNQWLDYANGDLYIASDEWSFTIDPSYVPPITPFPPDCCSNTENDYFWQPGVWSGDVYTDPYWGSGYVATGGGRWGRQLVVAGDNSVWYEALT